MADNFKENYKQFEKWDKREEKAVMGAQVSLRQQKRGE